MEGFEGADLPSGLWARGALELTDWKEPAVAIVGARRATAYGLAVAAQLSKELAQAGVIVVSGLAYGVDSASHRGVLAQGGRTVAVLGTGLDVFYPPSNRRLQEEEIPAAGLVVSEYPQGTGPQAAHFPRRNRIIAALSQAVIVVEGDLDSGALITARWAAKLGKEVFAVPGSILSSMSRGPNSLIRAGAGALTSINDLFEEMPDLIAKRPAGSAKRKSRTQGQPNAAPAIDANIVLKHLSSEPLGLDAILEKTGLDLGSASKILLDLEIGGWVKESAHGYILLKSLS